MFSVHFCNLGLLRPYSDGQIKFNFALDVFSVVKISLVSLELIISYGLLTVT